MEGSYKLSPLLKRLKDEGKLGFKSGEGVQTRIAVATAASNTT